MRLELVTAPTVEPLTAAEAKTRLGIGAEVADATMDSFIKAARQTIDGRDGWLGRALNTQTWKLLLPGFPCEPIRIPFPPLISVGSVKYYDLAGDLQTVDPGDYRILAGARPEIAPTGSWPSTTYRADAVEHDGVVGGHRGLFAVGVELAGCVPGTSADRAQGIGHFRAEA